MPDSPRMGLTSKVVPRLLQLKERIRPPQPETKVYRFDPLPSSMLEPGFSGPNTVGFCERLKEAISRLPSGYSGQIIFARSYRHASGNSSLLFPDYGLQSEVYLIEEHVQASVVSNFRLILEEIGVALVELEARDIQKLLSQFLGTREETATASLPDIVWEESYLRTPKSFIKAASLTDLANATWPGAVQALFEYAGEYLVSLKISVPDKAKTRRQLETKRRVSHALSAKKVGELSDLESGSTLNASEEVLLRITSGKETLFQVSLAAFVADKTLEAAESRIQSIVSEVNSASGCGIYVESFGTLPVFRSHLPGGEALSVRQLSILSGNLAHLMPLFVDYSRHQQPARIQFVSRCGESSHLNLFCPSNLNFNSFVCGASGSGKSFLTNSLLAAFHEEYPNSAMAIFDVGGSYRKLITHLNGTYVDLDSENATRLLATAFKKLQFKPNGYCKTLIENICGAGAHITHSHKVAIEDLLQSCEDAPFSLRLLSNEAVERKERVYDDIVLWLRPYLHWDDLEPSPFLRECLDGRIKAFDFKNLESDPLLQRLSILILTNGIWESLKGKEAPKTLIIFDEVWKFFSQAAGFLEEMYRTFRKYGAGIASITQNLADYGNDSFAKLVITNSFHRILLQGAANSELLSRTLDLGESDIKRFQSIHSKKNEYSEFWLGTPKFSQIFRLYPSSELFKLANSENIQKEALSA